MVGLATAIANRWFVHRRGLVVGLLTATLTNEAFGKKDAPVIVSWIVAGHQIGGALAAFGAGETRYVTGSYAPALLVLRIARSRTVTVRPND